MNWGDVQSSRSAPADTMFANTGRRLYVIGDVDGGFRPRSNPYDLHSFGAPHPNDHLAHRLQGVWAQPVKSLSGYTFVVQVKGETWPFLNAETFTQSFTEAKFSFRHDYMVATRTDFAAQDRPLLFTTLKLGNTGAEPAEVAVAFFTYFDLQDAWFTSVAAHRNHGETIIMKNNSLIACALSAPSQWAVVVGGDRPEASASFTRGADGHAIGQLEFTAHLEPGSELDWTIGIVVESVAGAEAAAQNLLSWLPQREMMLAEKRELYDTLIMSGPRLHSPDPMLDTAFDLARGNLQMLEAESPALGRYFYAGLETFPFWFCLDGPYSGTGLLATGLVSSTLNHLRIGARSSQAGCIPHQVSPSGDVVAGGNAQESPHWVVALWNAYCWTGDREFLAEMYPAALTSLFGYTLGSINHDGDGYPSGPSIVEREDMGTKKLDSAVYTWAALRDLAKMAEVLDDGFTAFRARSRASQLAAVFDNTWWDASNGTYSMSLAEADKRQLPAPHWAVIIPLEMKLATPEHAATTFATLRAAYMNRWGLKHTAGNDERVWTLPTALLSQAAYHYLEPALGFEMLRHLADTLDHGSIGMYHELIPEGLCLVQLWSAAQFVRGVVENLMGVEVRADRHTVTVTPQLPNGWDFAELENLSFGSHTVTFRVTRTQIAATHVRGSTPLTMTYRSLDGTEAARVVRPAEEVVFETASGSGE